MGQSSKALSALTPAELNGIIQRLALFEPPNTIAKGYKFPVKVIERVSEEYQDDIRALRGSWEKWINRVEPLTNRSNAIVFLGNLARRAAYEGAFTQAARIWQVLDQTYREAQTVTAHDSLVIDMIQRGDFDRAKRMAQEADTVEEERLLPEPSFAVYQDTSEASELEIALGLREPEEEAG